MKYICNDFDIKYILLGISAVYNMKCTRAVKLFTLYSVSSSEEVVPEVSVAGSQTEFRLLQVCLNTVDDWLGHTMLVLLLGGSSIQFYIQFLLLLKYLIWSGFVS